MGNEKFFYGSIEEDMFVSNARIYFGNKTYATNNITSVGTYEQKRYKIRLIWIAISMILGFVAMDIAPAFGIGFIAVSVMLLIAYLKKEYVVLIDSASGESEVLALPDKHEIREIVEAINKAIVYGHQTKRFDQGM
ncbi:DUF6232 family protein [Bacillus sp. Marseille-P3661]|uniref:DUF6232 family protein n=1 Tax=Bacillus sp. Marseille-P3661 TaxID=1936234 RepID=UPI000C850477|nr:DUF6232 family protein [Bacillus sp. Marseille-P3661]